MAGLKCSSILWLFQCCSYQYYCFVGFQTTLLGSYTLKWCKSVTQRGLTKYLQYPTNSDFKRVWKYYVLDSFDLVAWLAVFLGGGEKSNGKFWVINTTEAWIILFKCDFLHICIYANKNALCVRHVRSSVRPHIYSFFLTIKSIWIKFRRMPEDLELGFEIQILGLKPYPILQLTIWSQVPLIPSFQCSRVRSLLPLPLFLSTKSFFL